MTISFDPTRHAQLLKALADADAAIESHLTELETQSDALRAQWSGQAQQAYERTRARWAWQMLDRHATLKTASDAAQKAGELLVDANRRVTQSWRSLS
ncbi:WXG100 family type VII secretion target [uncultured Microbacterium sp.]|uniref:WXG100 family type VII secretion target n=1 Tax=uncultured Microbacterium sp. TaxID=191216 RepID=UPI0025ED20F1|nr:WXG100 family type VII secretion target [uncultured Microbacterium sp.]